MLINMLYTIYHRNGIPFDPYDETEHEFDYTHVGQVEANTLQEAFTRANNIDDDWNKENPCRSTSIGDAILHNATGLVYQVRPIGFKHIDTFPSKDINEEPATNYPGTINVQNDLHP